MLNWVKIVHGKWGLYDQTGPENFLIANAPELSARKYGHTQAIKMIKDDLPSEIRPVLAYIVQSAWQRPLDFVKLYLRKTYYYFNNYEIPNTVNFYLFQEYSPLLKWGSIPFSLLGSLGIMGFVLMLRQRQACTLLHGYFLANLVMCLMFLILSRYRLIMIPFLCMFSAYVLWFFWQKIRR